MEEEQGQQHEWDIVETDLLVIQEAPDGDRFNDYQTSKMLGAGAFGTVYLCERAVGEPPYRQFALKLASKKQLKKTREVIHHADGTMQQVTGVDKMLMEVQIMRRFFHRNIVCLFEMINDPDEDAIILILEYMAGGQVMKYDRGMRKFVYGPTGGVMDERTAAKLLLDLIDGVMYLHSRGIAHRDIKPDNLLVHENGTLRISDFGCAVQFEGDNEASGIVTDTAGTISFWAPECLSAGAAHDLPEESVEPHSFSAYSADVWAVGVTFYTFLHGNLPFFEDTPTALFASIQENTPAVDSSLSADAQQLLHRILCKEVQQRIPLAELRQSDWMAAARSDLQAALEALEQN